MAADHMSENDLLLDILTTSIMIGWSSTSASDSNNNSF